MAGRGIELAGEVGERAAPGSGKLFVAFGVADDGEGVLGGVLGFPEGLAYPEGCRPTGRRGGGRHSPVLREIVEERMIRVR